MSLLAYPHLTPDEMEEMRRSLREDGYAFVPRIGRTPMKITLEDFNRRPNILTRYGRKQLKSEYYGRVELSKEDK